MLIKGIIEHTVKIEYNSIIKIGRSVGITTLNAKYFDILLAKKRNVPPFIVKPWFHELSSNAYEHLPDWVSWR